MCAGGMKPCQQVSCFIISLKETICGDVCVAKPTTFSKVINYAKIYKAKTQAFQPMLPSFNQCSLGVMVTALLNLPQKPTGNLLRLSLVEINERWAKGLCFYCEKIFTLGHHYKCVFIMEAQALEDHEIFYAQEEFEHEVRPY